jgi:hypothetical protein
MPTRIFLFPFIPHLTITPWDPSKSALYYAQTVAWLQVEIIPFSQHLFFPPFYCCVTMYVFQFSYFALNMSYLLIRNCVFLFLVTVAQFLCLLSFRTRIHYLIFSYYGIIRRSIYLTRVADVNDLPVCSLQGKDQRKLRRMNWNKNERRRRYKISPKSCSLTFFVAQTSIKVGEVLYEQAV